MNSKLQHQDAGRRWLILAISLAAMSSAGAHPETNPAGGFIAGIEHPITGLDHIVAMVAVGLWGAYLGAPAIWLLPVIFPLVMAVGGAVGVLVGVPCSQVEALIALSGIVLGLMVATAARPPLWVAGVLVGFFAVFHGYSHGVELPHTANPLTYAAGFVISTGCLHLTGISLGLLTRWPWGRVLVRALGGVIMMVGFAFLFGFL
jgi:urease accessory protein